MSRSEPTSTDNLTSDDLTSDALTSGLAPAAPRLGRLPALDGLRAVAIAGVVLSHLAVPHLVGAAIGVEIFFVLSGFLITTLLLQEYAATERVDLLRFAARRALRLLPALVLVLLTWAAYLKLNHGVPLREETIGGLLPSLFYYANWARYFEGYHALGWLAPMWSLSVEEQFYLLWPVAFLLAKRSRLRAHLPALLLGTCGLVLAFRVHDLWGPSTTYRRFGTHEIGDQLLIGCLLAIALASPDAARRVRLTRLGGRLVPYALGYLAVVALTLTEKTSLAYQRSFYTVGLTLTAVSAAVVILHLVLTPEGRLSRLLSRSPLPWIGSISYGIYLWHEFVLMLATAGAPRPLWWTSALVLLGSVAVAAASFTLWERRFLALKRRL